jgi:hypothetical protein
MDTYRRTGLVTGTLLIARGFTRAADSEPREGTS